MRKVLVINLSDSRDRKAGAGMITELESQGYELVSMGATASKNLIVTMVSHNRSGDE